jgi:hypothetical protein
LWRAGSRVAGLLVFAIALLWLAGRTVYFARELGVAGDAFTYMAAGERLNAGHALYALSAGDRPVHIAPGFWNVPLLSPPLIAVLWRPIALAPEPLAVGSWWLAMTVAAMGVIVWLAARRPGLTGLVLILLTVPFAYQLLHANNQAMLLAGTIAVWGLAARGHGRASGALAGLLAVLKLAPVFLLVWFLVRKDRQALVGSGLGLTLGMVLSIVGSSPRDSIDFITVVEAGPTQLSFPGQLGQLDLPDPLPLLLSFAVFAAGVWVTRVNAGLSFAIAVAAMVFVPPAVNSHSLVLLMAALAPAIDPMRRAADAANLGPGRDPTTAYADATLDLSASRPRPRLGSDPSTRSTGRRADGSPAP